MKKQTRLEFMRNCLLLSVAGPLALRKLTFGEEKDPKKEKMITFCGLDCKVCPAYIATQANDDKLRAETAQKWSKMFKADIKPEQINCDGCTSDSKRIFYYCGICNIRKCGQEKKVKNCAYCPEYACDKLTAFFAEAPECKTALDEIRSQINKK